MKKIIVFVVICLTVPLCSGYAENARPEAGKIDMPTRLMLSKFGEKHKIVSSDYINVMMKITVAFDRNKAEIAGVRFGTFAGEVVTANVPVAYLETLANSDGVVYIDGGKTGMPTLDSVRSCIGADKVHSGEGLPKILSGKGVVIGIIDAGFDYTHPAFKDENGNCRIKRVWEQFREGNPPAGYSYGNNLSTPEEITAAGNDLPFMSHGTHVAGISAGSKVAGAEQYYGIAPEADIVIVALKPPSQDEWKNASLSDMIDGINYIYRYADSVGKPAVVNLSWGGQIGPHDGTSLFSQAVEELVGKGKIFCASAGNDGDTKLHLRKTFTSPTDTLRSFVLHKYDKNSEKNGIWLDVWGEKDKDFSAAFGIFNYADKSDSYNSGLFKASQDTTIEYKFIDGSDTCNINVIYEICPYNGKPHAFAEFSGNKAFRISLKAIAENGGTIDAWNWYLVDYVGITSNFTAMSQPNASAGDSSYTVSDLVCGKNAIAVGAFVTKNSFISSGGTPHSYNYEIGKKAFFTSLGPSADAGRTKPDISAPGMMLCSAVNCYDTTYYAGNANRSSVVLALKEDSLDMHETLYAMMSGTSMSSPVTTGSVALLLEAKADLNPNEIIKLLAETADTSGTSESEFPNNAYGAGKLNLFSAVLKLLSGDGVANVIPRASVYPNPFKDLVTIGGEFPETAEVVLFSFDGKIVRREKISGAERYELTGLDDLPAGSYYVAVYSGEKAIAIAKCVKSK